MNRYKKEAERINNKDYEHEGERGYAIFRLNMKMLFEIYRQRTEILIRKTILIIMGRI